MQTLTNGLTIGAVARAAGVHVETIRFYQRKGLLSEPLKPHGSVRRYGARDVARLQFIKSAQSLGFTLDEIAVLLELDGGMHCDQAREVGERKLQDVRAKLAGLKRIETALSEMIRACACTHGAMSCPLIESLRVQQARDA